MPHKKLEKVAKSISFNSNTNENDNKWVFQITFIKARNEQSSMNVKLSYFYSFKFDSFPMGNVYTYAIPERLLKNIEIILTAYVFNHTSLPVVFSFHKDKNDALY